MSVFIKLFNIAGPTDLKVSNMLPNGFTISFTAPLGNPAISDFIITVGDESKQDVCRLEKAETPRWCDFNYLTPDTEYPVSIVCCLGGEAGCSAPLTGKAKTTSRFIYSYYKLATMQHQHLMSFLF